ncbi:MAG: hypothetical protein ACLFWG_02600 [Longimicrobiales bacterium]
MRRRPRPGVRIVVLLSLSAFVGFVPSCSPETGDRRLVTQVETTDSAGVSRVRILDLFGLGIPEVTARRVWTTDVSELHEVRDAWIEADGSVLLANAGNAEIVRLDSTGGIMARFGAAGEGPGEFAQFGLSWIDGSRDGRIAAYDERLARITEFAPDGTVLGTHRVAPSGDRISLQAVAYLAEGRILATYGEVRRFDREGLARDTVPLLSIPFGEAADSPESAAVASVDTLGLWPGQERQISRTPEGAARVPVGFANDFLYDGAGRVAAVSSSEAVELRVFEDGQLVVMVEADAPARAVRAEDADALREDFAARSPDRALDDLWSEAPVNEIYPTLDRIVVTQDGSVWMGIHPEFREDRRTFILIGRRGFPVGRLRLPKEATVLAVRGDRAVVSTRTELEEVRIALLNIE